MLNSTENEIDHAHNVKIPTNAGILTCLTMKNKISEHLKAGKGLYYSAFYYK